MERCGPDGDDKVNNLAAGNGALNLAVFAKLAWHFARGNKGQEVETHMKVNMKQISEITGVSTATVSNALNYKKGVNANTAARVLKVAYELGYFEESRSITKVKFVTFKRDGSVVEDTPFFPLMLTGIEQECRDSGMDMIMCTIR